MVLIGHDDSNIVILADHVSKVFGGPGTFLQKGSWSPKAKKK